MQHRLISGPATTQHNIHHLLNQHTMKQMNHSCHITGLSFNKKLSISSCLFGDMFGVSGYQSLVRLIVCVLCVCVSQKHAQEYRLPLALHRAAVSLTGRAWGGKKVEAWRQNTNGHTFPITHTLSPVSANTATYSLSLSLSLCPRSHKHFTAKLTQFSRFLEKAYAW